MNFLGKTQINHLSIAMLGGILLLGIAGSSIMSRTPSHSKYPIMAHSMHFPLIFEINKGQTASQVNYLSRNNNYTLYFTPQELVLDFRRLGSTNTKHGKFHLAPIKTSNDVLRIKFVGANQSPTIVGEDKLKSKSNYFISNDPTKWQRNVANYSKVLYKNVYSGIDIVFYGNHNELEYDIRVAPGVDPTQAHFNVTGAKSVELNTKGDLVLAMPEGEKIFMHKPNIYQMIGGVKHPVAGKFTLSKQQFGFQIANYNKKEPLIIDPSIVYSTYLGGSGGSNVALGVAADPTETDSATYVTGFTNSIDFPTQGPFQGVHKGKGRNVFVSKISRDGSSLIYSTYLGGSGGNDEGFAIAVDTLGSAYITGETNSKDFPLKNPFQATNRGARDFSGFVAKLNPEGNDLFYSTYLGGSGENQEGNAIVVDNQGFAYVTGETTSTDFPTKNPFQATNKGPKFTAYVTKFSSLGDTLVWSTYLGGSAGQDEGNAIGLDVSKNVYIVGETNSKDFPTLNPIQAHPKPRGAGQTGFVTKLSANGQSLIYSTYYGGGGGNDYPLALSVGPQENLTFVGYTNSTDFPLVNAIQTSNKGPNFTGFVTKFNAQGNTVLYSTYFGGSGGHEQITSLQICSLRHAHFSGFTDSKDIPLASPIQASNLGSGTTGFYAFLNFNGTLAFSSYLGGSGGNDRVWGTAVDSILSVHLVGETNSNDFPLVNPLQSTKTSNVMAFVTKVST